MATPLSSRQYAWQLKRRAEGKCVVCGWLRAPGSADCCAYHAEKRAAYQLARVHEALGRPPRAYACSYCGKLGHNRRSHQRHLPRAGR